VVATTGPSLGRSLVAFEEVRRALTGEPVSLLRQRIPDSAAPAIDSISRGTPRRVFVAAPILQDQRIVATVLLWRTPIALSQVLHGKRYHLLLATALLLGTVVSMSMLTSFTVVRPLQALVRQAQRATAGEKGAVTPLARPVTREIAELSHAVAAMARYLEQRADYIRTFAARGAVELLRDHLDTMTVTERERFLSHLDQDAARLERLVRRLLELARADVMQVSAGDRAEVAAVVRRLAARYRDAGLTVSVIEPLPAASVAMAEDVLESILGNLLDNARQRGAGVRTVLHHRPGAGRHRPRPGGGQVAADRASGRHRAGRRHGGNAVANPPAAMSARGLGANPGRYPAAAARPSCILRPARLNFPSFL
jgi:signal transduction histidine kinase